jgi:hypothetical protein
MPAHAIACGPQGRHLFSVRSGLLRHPRYPLRLRHSLPAVLIIIPTSPILPFARPRTHRGGAQYLQAGWSITACGDISILSSNSSNVADYRRRRVATEPCWKKQNVECVTDETSSTSPLQRREDAGTIELGCDAGRVIRTSRLSDCGVLEAGREAAGKSRAAAHGRANAASAGCAGAAFCRRQ